MTQQMYFLRSAYGARNGSTHGFQTTKNEFVAEWYTLKSLLLNKKMGIQRLNDWMINDHCISLRTQQMHCACRFLRPRGGGQKFEKLV